MEFVKECRVMVERLNWEDLQFHKLSLRNSEMSLVNLQRLAIKEEMDYEENCNYDHLSKDNLINEVKARDDRIRKLEAERNVLISNLEKEGVKTMLTINKQIDEIERLNRVINDLERRIKDLMEKSGIHQLINNEYVKTEPVENDLEINVQELSLPIVMHGVQGILVKEDSIQESLVFEPQYVAEFYNTNTEIEIASINTENMGFITRNTNPCVPKPNCDYSLPQSALSLKIKVENQFEMSPDTNTESESPREPLENNINVNDSLLKSQSESTEGETDVNRTPSQKFSGPELNVEVEKHLDLSLDANVESDSLERVLENGLDDNQSEIALTDAKKTDNSQHKTVELFIGSRSLSVPVCVPKLERNRNELSELNSVSIHIDVPEVPIQVENNISVSNSETLEGVAPKIPEGKTSSPRSEIAGTFKKKSTSGFKNLTEYKRALQRRIRKGNEEKRFKCDQCDNAFTRKSNLIAHQRLHSGEKPFVCDQCDFSSSRKYDLIVHKRVHSGEKPFKCDQCGYGFTQKSSLNTHQRIHSGEKPFVCDQCSFACSRKRVLIAHQHVHSGEKPFKCDQCGYGFTQKSSLIKYQRLHSGEKPFKCEQCEYASPDKGSLNRHEHIHSGEKPFICYQCNFASSRKGNLLRHQLVHSDEKPFKCEQCEYASTDKSSLIRHENIHSGEKPFKCDQCEYKCTHHSVEKPFKCDQCEYKCTHHSVEKPFKCDQCEYKCTHKSSLIRHERIHSGEKPFKCDRCDYAFTQNCHLTVHKRKRHMYE